MPDNKHIPLVSVLLPVYNSAAYVKSAIESILKQTFIDFELLIINDGSTDNSFSLISSFSDSRIRIINNEKNIGLTATLNKGIDLAKGKYIARMDADDISFPERFEKQINYLEKNITVSLLATRTALINTEGEITGEWNDDVKYTDGNSIRKQMAFSNCIVHPSIMIRADILKKYKYNDYQKSAEDWDLWLRLLADGHKIHKLNDILLHYRVHPQSTMAGEKQITLQQRLIKIKRKFLAHQFPKLNSYYFLVFYSLLRNCGSHLKFNVLPPFLRSIKRFLTSSPFTVISQYSKLKNTLATHKTNTFFFFPYTHIGGAEQVHADIVRVFKEQKPLVFFTAFSKDKKFLNKFEENAFVLNIPDALNYPFLYKKSQKLISDYINKQDKAAVFGSNSGYFYEISSFLSSQTKIIDLIHAFKYQSEGNDIHKKYLAVSQKFSNRVFVSSAALEEFKKFCFHQNCSRSYFSKLKLIRNCVKISPFTKKQNKEALQVLFVGRNSEEKRFPLFLKIAGGLNTELPGKFSFHVIGIKGNIFGINFYGEISNKIEIQKHYLNADTLILTSYREGFPMVIMEAMANGVVPISTPVGDIPTHIKSDNGFLTSDIKEETVVTEMCEKLKWLSENKNELNTLSENAYNYAKANFSEERFAAEYKSLFNA
ncbi:MAG TPA: glycosyltransferase [Bacteroidia bacterium]|jgi:glycosyltransferase involved in cell wall biosynthesis|nr:glycosyltransferase [Bacteroidia bacterium]